MDRAAEGVLSVRIYYINSKEEKSVGDLTATEFESQRRSEPTFTSHAEAYKLLAPPLYDAIWGSALALNCTMNVMHDRGRLIFLFHLKIPYYKKRCRLR